RTRAPQSLARTATWLIGSLSARAPAPRFCEPVHALERAPGRRLAAQLIKYILQLPAVERHRPDHQQREHDHQDRPDWLVRDRQKVIDRTDERDDDRDKSRPSLANEQIHPRGPNDEAENHLDPAPCRDVDIE